MSYTWIGRAGGLGHVTDRPQRKLPMEVHLNNIEIPNTLALAVMAALGYVFGTLRQRRMAAANGRLCRPQNDVSRAQIAVGELEQVIRGLRNSTAEHYARLKRFQNRVARLGAQPADVGWYELCREVDDVLDPTLQLVNEINSAQQRIRCQNDYLMTLAETQTDPLAELANRPSAGPVQPDEAIPVALPADRAQS
jgi:hypothetical protein